MVRRIAASRPAHAACAHVPVARQDAAPVASDAGVFMPPRGILMRLSALILLAVFGCGVAPFALAADPELEKQALLRLHEADRKAHFDTDVDALMRGSPDAFISVANGKIHRLTEENERRFFTQYFGGATYFEWDDIEEPVVRVSADGSMAWMVTRIRVRRTQPDAAGNDTEQAFVYAGIMTYEKQGDRWTRTANVSTFEPAGTP
jgi:hypothetical protein